MKGGQPSALARGSVGSGRGGLSRELTRVGRCRSQTGECLPCVELNHYSPTDPSSVHTQSTATRSLTLPVLLPPFDGFA